MDRVGPAEEKGLPGCRNLFGGESEGGEGEEAWDGERAHRAGGGTGHAEEDHPSGRPGRAADGKREARELRGSIVCVVGFHHSLGHTIEWSYPAIDAQGAGSAGKPEVRPQDRAAQRAKGLNWSHLAFLALPEGAHNQTVGLGHVFFSIELEVEGGHALPHYGVALYGQVKTEDLVVAERDATRNHVQKSVCLLSREPCFRWMLSALRPAAELYFDQRDFSNRSVLVSALRSFAGGDSQSVHCITTHQGLSPAGLVRRFGRKLLSLYKLMLLETRIVLFAPRCQDVSRLVLSLASLVPGLLPALSPHFHAPRPEGVPPGKPSLLCGEGDKQSNHPSLLSAHGLPLHIFHRMSRLYPYVPMEVMMSGVQKEGGLLAGSSNAFLVGSPPAGLLHVLANCETGSVVVHRQELASAGHLSAFERKFMDEVVAKVEQRGVGMEGSSDEDNADTGRGDWEGSGDWVRAKFEEYTLRLLQAAARQSQLSLVSSDVVNKEVLENEMPRMYGSAWISKWKETRSYNRWAAEHDLAIAHISRAPKSPAVIGSIKDGFQAGVLDIRNSVRMSVGAKSGIRAAVKSRFSSLFGSTSSLSNTYSASATSGSSSVSPSLDPFVQGLTEMSSTPRSSYTTANVYSPPRSSQASRSLESSPRRAQSPPGSSKAVVRVTRPPSVATQLQVSKSQQRRRSAEAGIGSVLPDRLAAAGDQLSAPTSIHGSSESDEEGGGVRGVERGSKSPELSPHRAAGGRVRPFAGGLGAVAASRRPPLPPGPGRREGSGLGLPSPTDSS